MTGAAILAIVVATSEINDPATAIMIGAAGESLGSDVAIRLLAADQPDDVDALRIERETGAGAVVTLVWRDASRLRARMRLHVAASGHTTTRELVFSEADTRVERGRTLGLAAASMWPEIRAPAATPPAPPPSPRPNAPVPAPAAVSAAIVRAAPSPSAAPRFALGLAAVVGSGDARAFGARVESAFSAGGSWSLRAALSARTGSIPALADGRLWTFALAGGVEWWPVALRAGGRARFGVRADALALRHQVSGVAAAGASESRGRFLPAFDLMAQTALRASARIDLLAAVGAEAALGQTDIRTGTPPAVVAKIPPFQLVAEVGLRVGF
jgi:hypothetical protein